MNRSLIDASENKFEDDEFIMNCEVKIHENLMSSATKSYSQELIHLFLYRILVEFYKQGTVVPRMI